MNFKKIFAGVGGVAFLGLGSYLQTADVITLQGALQILGASILAYLFGQKKTGA